MKIHAGTSGFAYKEWKGSFYPAKLSPREMLRFYSEHLGTVEINNTFYRMPSESVLKAWAGQVPEDFLFSFKAPQLITHLKRLRDVAEETEYLFTTLSVLGARLGPVLFQFPASFRADRAVLDAFLELLPAKASCAFEFRHPSWLDDSILNLLRRRRLGLCVADTDEKPATGIVSTSSWGYMRLRRSAYTEAELAQWIRRILSQQWDKAFVFFKHEDEGAAAPALAMRLRELVASGTAGRRASV